MYYEEESSNILNKIYSIGLGLLPILAILKFNIQGITVERIFLLIFALIVLLRLCTRYSLKVNKKPFITIVIYCLIVTANIFVYESCGAFGEISLWLILGIDLAVSPGLLLDFSTFKKTVSFVAIVCSILIIVQYLLYYGTGTYWNPVPTQLYRQDVINAYSNFLLSGLEGSLLRPSAIFLEPSHFAEYAIVALVIQLFFNEESLKKPIIITAGILLCTSGLGIIAAVIAWGIKIFGDKTVSGNKKIITIFGIAVAVAIAYFVLESIGAASLILSKFSINSGNSGFVSRFGEVAEAFRNWSFRDYLLGEGFDSVTNYWLPGYFSIVRQIGIIGLISMISILITIFKISDKMGKCLVVVYAWLLLVAEVSTMTYMVFYLAPACFAYLTQGYCAHNKIMGDV